MNLTSHLTRLTGESIAKCYCGASGYEALIRPTETLVLSGQPYADLNYAVMDDSMDAPQRLEAFVTVAGKRSLPFIVMATPEVSPKLCSVARTLGLDEGGTFPLMIRDDSLPPKRASDFECHPVRDVKALHVANQLLSRASGIPEAAVHCAYGSILLTTPGFNIFIAYKNSEPICTVQTTQFGGDVGIWGMVTPPELQRQGAGSALLDFIFTYHLQRGATRFFLGSTLAGKRLYQRAGFKKIDEWTVWLNGASSQTG